MKYFVRVVAVMATCGVGVLLATSVLGGHMRAGRAPEVRESLQPADRSAGAQWLIPERSASGVRVPRTIDTEADLFRGSAKAPVVLIEYGNYRCEFCSRFEKETYGMIKEDYVEKGLVRFVYRNLTTSQEASQLAATAALCAKEQGKFWPMHERLMQDSQKLALDDVRHKAMGLGLVMQTYEACVRESHFDATFQADATAARAMGIRELPLFIVGEARSTDSAIFVHETIVGAQALGPFRRAIEAILQRPGQQGSLAR